MVRFSTSWAAALCRVLLAACYAARLKKGHCNVAEPQQCGTVATLSRGSTSGASDSMHQYTALGLKPWNGESNSEIALSWTWCLPKSTCMVVPSRFT